MRFAISVLVLCLVCVHGSYGQSPNRERARLEGVCQDTDTNARPINSSQSWRVFNQLTRSETQQVLNFMIEELGYYDPRGSGSRPTTSGPNLIYRVELMEPVKDEVLDYIDGEGPRPDRFAFVVVVRSENQPKDVMEYKVRLMK